MQFKKKKNPPATPLPHAASTSIPKCPLNQVEPLQYLNRIEVNTAYFSTVCAVGCLQQSCDPAAAATLTRPPRQSASPSLLPPVSSHPTPAVPLIIIAQRQMANGGGAQPYTVHGDVLATWSRSGSEALRCGFLLLSFFYAVPFSLLLPSLLFGSARPTATSSLASPPKRGPTAVRAPPSCSRAASLQVGNVAITGDGLMRWPC